MTTNDLHMPLQFTYKQNYSTESALLKVTCTKLAALYNATKSFQNSCTAKLQLFSSILEAKQQLNLSCRGMQKCCVAFEALGSSFAAQLPTFKCCEIVAVTLQFTRARSDKTTFLSAHNLNRQKGLLPQITAFITRKL